MMNHHEARKGIKKPLSYFRPTALDPPKAKRDTLTSPHLGLGIIMAQSHEQGLAQVRTRARFHSFNHIGLLV